jgi:hypothetical protein
MIVAPSFGSSLMLESRPGKDGPQWQFAFAPMTGFALNASWKGKRIWSKSAEGNGSARNPSNTFYIRRVLVEAVSHGVGGPTILMTALRSFASRKDVLSRRGCEFLAALLAPAPDRVGIASGIWDSDTVNWMVQFLNDPLTSANRSSYFDSVAQFCPRSASLACRCAQSPRHDQVMSNCKQ